MGGQLGTLIVILSDLVRVLVSNCVRRIALALEDVLVGGLPQGLVVAGLLSVENEVWIVDRYYLFWERSILVLCGMHRRNGLVASRCFRLVGVLAHVDGAGLERWEHLPRINLSWLVS